MTSANEDLGNPATKKLNDWINRKNWALLPLPKASLVGGVLPPGQQTATHQARLQQEHCLPLFATAIDDATAPGQQTFAQTAASDGGLSLLAPLRVGLPHQSPVIKRLPANHRWRVHALSSFPSSHQPFQSTSRIMFVWCKAAKAKLSSVGYSYRKTHLSSFSYFKQRISNCCCCFLGEEGLGWGRGEGKSLQQYNNNIKVEKKVNVWLTQENRSQSLKLVLAGS